MRPTRLELGGFTAFRQPTAVDFSGAELFALVGPTGAGKTSLLDAMCFALYGTVPRLDRREVAPVISAGLLEARVRFDFTVGEIPYTAVRVVRRQRTGATTKEARLEAGDQVLAGDADGMTEQVEALLGLGFEQFTKSVVLPQGQFARFLHDKPGDRQDLLVRLLELGVYDRMREAARVRRGTAEATRAAAEQHLATLAGATPEALAGAEAAIVRLEGLRSRVEEAVLRLEALERERQAVRDAGRTASEHVTLIERVVVPADVAALAQQVAAASKAAETAQTAMDDAQAALEKAQQVRAALPEMLALEQVRTARQELETVAERMVRGEPLLEKARADELTAEQALSAAQAARGAAESQREDLRRAHAAHALGAGISVGDLCPVCEQEVRTLPSREEPAGLAAAEAGLKAADQAVRAAGEELRRRGEQRAKNQQTMDELVRRRDQLERQLAERWSSQEVGELIAAVTEAERVGRELTEAERLARAGAQKELQVLDAARQRRDAAWGEFDTARDRVAALGPPPVERADLPASWAALAAWARARLPEDRSRAAAAADQEAKAAAAITRLEAELRADCGANGVAVGDRRPRDAVADALAAAHAERGRLVRDLETVERLSGQVVEAGERTAVARVLERHLMAGGFERWLLDEALAALVDGANEMLGELSQGQYALAIDERRNFSVVDHRNADEHRPARTLSGGETFLASLALALSLAEQLSATATGSTPRLESIFLDEGFGTLDPQTLDVVAAAIEELGARGRTVGLVTHVRDLAERMPVRFEVREGPGGATVQRVDV